MHLGFVLKSDRKKTTRFDLFGIFMVNLQRIDKESLTVR